MIHLIINGRQRSFKGSEFTISELVTRLGVEGKRVAIERNGEIVPRSVFAQTLLNADDKLEIVGAVGGG